MNLIRKGDEVIVIAGKDKGRKGTVLTVMPKEGKLIVDGINISKKHVKANPNTNEKGGILIKPMPIDRSNVMLVNPTTDSASRVGIKKLEDGRLVRYYKSTGDTIES